LERVTQASHLLTLWRAKGLPILKLNLVKELIGF